MSCEYYEGRQPGLSARRPPQAMAHTAFSVVIGFAAFIAAPAFADDAQPLRHLRGGYSEGWTVFWITAHLLNTAAQFETMGVNLDRVQDSIARSARGAGSKPGEVQEKQ